MVKQVLVDIMPDFVLSKKEPTFQKPEQKTEGSNPALKPAQLCRSYLEQKVAPLLDEIKRASIRSPSKKRREKLASCLASLSKSEESVIYPSITTLRTLFFQPK